MNMKIASRSFFANSTITKQYYTRYIFVLHPPPILCQPKLTFLGRFFTCKNATETGNRLGFFYSQFFPVPYADSSYTFVETPGPDRRNYYRGRDSLRRAKGVVSQTQRSSVQWRISPPEAKKHGLRCAKQLCLHPFSTSQHVLDSSWTF